MRLRITVLAFCSLLALCGVAIANAQQPVDARQALADQYAPVVYLKHQSKACDTKGEAFARQSRTRPSR
jgi:hypothetical protein